MVLPLEEYAAFKDQLSDDPEFEFEVKESKPIVFIKTIADRIEIKFRKFIDELKKYLDFDGRRYIAFEKKNQYAERTFGGSDQINK